MIFFLSKVSQSSYFAKYSQCTKERGGKMKTFAEKAYDLLRKVPKGRVTTYKEIAHALETRAYRGVGQAMRRNPYAPEVP
jgi:O6-methylguanine-DNA--protein-cysteine methyltransferase